MVGRLRRSLLSAVGAVVSQVVSLGVVVSGGSQPAPWFSRCCVVGVVVVEVLKRSEGALSLERSQPAPWSQVLSGGAWVVGVFGGSLLWAVVGSPRCRCGGRAVRGGRGGCRGFRCCVVGAWSRC